MSGGIDEVGSGKIYLVGAGVGGARNSHAGCGVCAPAARGRDRARTGERQSGEQRAEAEGRTEQPTTARRCSVEAWIRMLSGLERRPSATACLLTAASPSALSVSPPASSASRTSKNAPCSQEISTGLLLKIRTSSEVLFLSKKFCGAKTKT